MKPFAGSVVVLCVLLVCSLGEAGSGEYFIRGDANGDAASHPASPVDIADAVHVLGYLFSSGPAPGCLQAADANDDEIVDLGDAISILAGLFSGGPPPAAPHPTCGADPTPGALSCVSYPPCDAFPPLVPGLTHSGTNVQGYEEYTLDLDPTIVMILIPGATFAMGDEELAYAQPVHPVTLSSYMISKYEISNAQYLSYCDQTGAAHPPAPLFPAVPTDYFTDPQYADHPVTMVSWNDLTAPGGFLEWTGLALPTEAQWEYAARGPEGFTHPWGNEQPNEAAPPYRASYCAPVYPSCAEDGYQISAPIDAPEFVPYSGPFGAVHQSGNVEEWCLDGYDLFYPPGPAVDPVGPPETVIGHIFRGGGFSTNYLQELRSTARNGNVSSHRFAVLGFRPARSVP